MQRLEPKQLMPTLEAVLREPKAAGITRITMTVGYPAELLQTLFFDSKCLGLQSDCFVEERPLGTVGLPSLISSLGTRQSF